MTMWTALEPVEDDVSDLPAIDPENKHRRSRRRAWRDGLAAQTVIETLEDVRSYRSFERTIIASIRPRSGIELELAYRLTALFWRLRRAGAIETGLFEIQGESGCLREVASRSHCPRSARRRYRCDLGAPSLAQAKSCDVSHCGAGARALLGNPIGETPI
jgi:hypothetical protein